MTPIPRIKCTRVNDVSLYDYMILIYEQISKCSLHHIFDLLHQIHMDKKTACLIEVLDKLHLLFTEVFPAIKVHFF
jgi:hypothetical protein